MISIESAAGVMFGNLQCTNMRAVMDALPEAEVVRLLTEWRSFIMENRETAVARIIHSVAAHPALASAWNEKDIDRQRYHIKIFRIIVADIEPAEKAAAPNRSEASNLNSTSSARGSES